MHELEIVYNPIGQWEVFIKNPAKEFGVFVPINAMQKKLLEEVGVTADVTNYQNYKNNKLIPQP